MNIAANDIATWSPNFEAYGNTYIVWGTEGIYPPYIVVSASESQRIEEIDIQQGAGFTAILILLMDGLDVDIEVIDDTSIAPPTIAGNPFVIVTPYGSVPMALVSNKANQARKREGMRNFTFKSFTAISGLHTIIGLLALSISFFQ
jgi:hypothetical protein